MKNERKDSRKYSHSAPTLILILTVLVFISAIAMIQAGYATDSGWNSSSDNSIGYMYATVTPQEADAEEGTFDINEEFPVSFGMRFTLASGSRVIGGLNCTLVGNSTLTLTSSEAAPSCDVRISVAPTMLDVTVDMTVYCVVTRDASSGDPILVSDGLATIATFLDSGDNEITLTFYAYKSGYCTEREKKSLEANFVCDTGSEDITYSTSAPSGGFNIANSFPVPMTFVDWTVQGEEKRIHGYKELWKVGETDLLVTGTPTEIDLMCHVVFSDPDDENSPVPGFEIYACISGYLVPALVNDENAQSIGTVNIESEGSQIVRVVFYAYYDGSFNTSQIRNMHLQTSVNIFGIAEVPE